MRKRKIVQVVSLIALLVWGIQLNGQSVQFEQLDQHSSLNNLEINAIFQASSGYLWIGTWSGLYRYDGYESRMVLPNPDIPGSPENAKITCITEDNQARLWVGTRQSGLIMFDPASNTILVYQHETENANSLSNNNVRSIQADEYGNIWLGTEKGLDRFQPSDQTFEHIPFDQENSQPIVYALCINPAGLWAGTENGLFHWTASQESVYPQRMDLHHQQASSDPEIVKRDNFIYSLSCSRYLDDVLWVGTQGGLKKISQASTSSPTIDYYSHRPGDSTSLSHDFVQWIEEVEVEGRYQLWLATLNGLNCMDPFTATVNRYYASTTEPLSLNNNKITSLCFDSFGLLWIGSLNGLNKVDLYSNPFNNIKMQEAHSLQGTVVSTLEGSKLAQGIWIGSRGGGLTYLAPWDRESEPAPLQPKEFHMEDPAHLNRFITDLVLDQQGYLWISTEGEGVIRVKEETLLKEDSPVRDFEQFASKNNQLHDNYVMVGLLSSRQNIWFGHWNTGLEVYVAQADSFVYFSSTSDGQLDLKEFPIVCLYEHATESDTSLWVGTRGGGVYQLAFDPRDQSLALLEKFQHKLDDPNTMSSNSINMIEGKDAGAIWIATENGLNRLNPKTREFQHIGVDDGLPNRVVQSILIHEDGSLWLSTIGGLCQVSWEQDSMLCQAFVQEGGMTGNNFFYDAVWEDPTGNIYFGSTNGLTRFHPSHIHVQTIPPIIQWQELEIMNQHILPGVAYDGRTILPSSLATCEELFLSPDDGVISISFIALHFDHPPNNQYAYRLLGKEESWTLLEPGTRVVHLSNLASGTYTFEVKAANSDGQWSTKPARLKIHINNPWWSTEMLLLALVCILLILAIVAMIRIRSLSPLPAQSPPLPQPQLATHEAQTDQKEVLINLPRLEPSVISVQSADTELLEKMTSIVEKYIAESNFSVERLAEELNMSRTQLYRKVKALTGSTPIKVIRSFRLKRAAQLLKSEQYTVSEVTYQVGYNDLKSFREQFKKEFGVSPSEYIKQNPSA